MAQHEATPAAGEHEAQRDVDGSGLPCSVGAEEPEDLALLHAQGKSVQRLHGLVMKKAAVLPGDVVEFERGGRHSLLATSSWLPAKTLTCSRIRLPNESRNRRSLRLSTSWRAIETTSLQ